MALRNKAGVKDFRLLRNQDDTDQAYQFRVDPAETDEIAEAVQAMVARIKRNEATMDEKRDYLWTVRASDRNRIALEGIFDNFAVVYEQARSQLRLL